MRMLVLVIADQGERKSLAALAIQKALEEQTRRLGANFATRTQAFPIVVEELNHQLHLAHEWSKNDVVIGVICKDPYEFLDNLYPPVEGL